MPCSGDKSASSVMGYRITLFIILALTVSGQINADTPVVPTPASTISTYHQIYSSISSAKLKRDINTFSGVGSRIAGYPGEKKSADFVYQQMVSTLGKQNVHVDTFHVVVPFDPGVADPAKESYVQMGNQHLVMYPVWPNLVRTSTLPINGLTAPLIYVGDGNLRNFNGKNVAGSVVLMDFNCGEQWLNAPRLGAKAVIFIAPNSTMRGEADSKFLGIPVSIPRFYMTQKQAAPLLAACEGGMPPTATLYCNMPWKQETCRNFTGILPGSDPGLSKQVIVIQSYYDSISVVPALAPGAESSCGISAMLQMMHNFKLHPPKRTIWFVATSAHFEALQGIRDYLNKHMNQWMNPDLVQTAMQQQNESKVGICLALVLLIVIVQTIYNFRRSASTGKLKVNGSMIALLISVVLLAGLNIVFFLSKHEPAGKKPPAIYLWCGLDLSSHSRTVGIFYKGWFYDFREDIQSRFSDIGRVCKDDAVDIGTQMGFDGSHFFNDGINPDNGKNWRNYIPGQPAFDAEPVTMAGGDGVTFATTNDSRNLVDTPFDTANRVNVSNLAFQTRLLTCVIWHMATDPNDVADSGVPRLPIMEAPSWSRMALQGGFSTLDGHIETFNPKKSFISTPDPKLADSLVVLTNNVKSYMGVRGNMIVRTQWAPSSLMHGVPVNANGIPLHVDPKTGEALASNGRKVPCEDYYSFPGVAPLTAYGYTKTVTLAAYELDNASYRQDPADPVIRQPDPHRGDIDYAPDLGPEGAEATPLSLSVTSAHVATPVVLFRCVPTAIYDLVDQQSLEALTGISIFDGITDGTPRMYGYALAPLDPTQSTSYVEDLAVIFAQPGARLKIAMTDGPGDIRLLLINAKYNPDHPFNTKYSPYPSGEGYLVAGNVNERQGASLVGKSVVTDASSSSSTDIARSGAIYDTALHVAEDMWDLDDYRMRRLAEFRILNMKSKQGVPGLHNMAYAEIVKAKEAEAAKNWELFDARSREAWGLESRAYPDVQQTAMDVVEGVIFYLALMMPFAYFAERLLFGFFDLKRQLSAAALIFLFVFIIFRYIHPAFQITMNPVIVLLAFVMLALSCIVIAMITGKFEEQVKQMTHDSSGVHRADIGRVSVAVAAFNLGISNMRRRKTRTALTCITLILLTFTVLSFTSVVQVLKFNKVPAPSDYGPRYSGIEIRTPMWDPLQEPAYRILADEYGRNYAVAPRAWFYGTSPGDQSFLTLTRADRTYDARALAGLSPEEAKITRPQDALLTDSAGKPVGRWFKPGDRYDVILPDTIAQALHIDLKDVGTAEVDYSGVEYRVIGILDSQKMKRYLDLDNEMITPVDFIAMSKESSSSGGGGGGSKAFQNYIHLQPDMVFYIPYRTAMDLGAQLRSIAIDFNNPQQVMQQLDPLMHRLDLNIYAGQVYNKNATSASAVGKVYRFSSIASTSSSGIELVIFPIILASLIVLNTMLNSVFERVKEIHIFSSIGLAPSHIGMLFIAEALVYGILGSVLGYILGQFTSKLLVITGWMPSLYLNYSSTSAVGTTLIVVTVVLLSTIYPARKAAEVASPSSSRSWRLPDPVEDSWTVPLPFAVTGDQAAGLNAFLTEWLQAYEEYSIGDFVTQGVKSTQFTSEYGNSFRINCMSWLAPFDLGVSQQVMIETTPTEVEDVFEVTVYLTRVSGDVSNWKRVNRRYLNTVRKQFLIWRTLKQADRDRYITEAREYEEAVLV